MINYLFSIFENVFLFILNDFYNFPETFERFHISN